MLRLLILAILCAIVSAGGCGEDDEPTLPATTTGSCCATTGGCTVTTLTACLGAWTALGACDPYPCPPPWTDPIMPERVLRNVQVTFSAKSVTNYERSLAGDFTFVPAPADRDLVVSMDPTFYDDWSKQREVATFASVFRQSEGVVTFIWGPPVPSFDEMLSDNADPGGGRYYQNVKNRMVFHRAGADTTISGLAGC